VCLRSTSTNFDYPQDVASVHKSFAVVLLTIPANLDKAAYDTDMGRRMIWETTMKAYMRCTEKMESNLRAIYAIMWGQSSPMMQSKLESLDEYEARSTDCDCVWLLKEIQGIMHRFEGTPNVFISLDDAWCNYCSYHQGAQQSLHEYLKEYQLLVQVLEHYGAAIGGEGPYFESVKDRLRTTLLSTVAPQELHKRAVDAAKLQTIAIGFMKRADKRRYGGLWSELENNFTHGQDHYPVNFTNAYNLLLNYKAAPGPGQRPPRRDRTDDEETTGVSFLQDGSLIPGTDGETHHDIKCYNCNKKGHYAGSCPDAEGVQMLQMADINIDNGDDTYESAFSFLNVGHQPEECLFTQVATGHNLIPSTWILLHSQLTVSMSNNRHLLSDIRTSPRTLRVHTNSGAQLLTQMGHMKNFGHVWFNPNSLANILSMAKVRKVCRITMDTSVEPAMSVHRRDGSIMKFNEYKSGLYYFDTAAPTTPNSTSFDVNVYSFLHTVEQNKQAYTRREIEGADRARELYKKIRRPSGKEFTDILQNNNLIRKCPVTRDDAKRALQIYGPDVATLQGKTVKKQNSGIPNYQAVQIPAPIIAQYNSARLFVDIFWVNKSLYFHTISEWVKFRTVAAINNRTQRTLHMETQAVIKLYKTRGFTVTRVEGNRYQRPST
jgi:hypothetical protein